MLPFDPFYLLGRLMVVWGVMMPVMAFPMMNGYQPSLGVLGSMNQMHLYLEVVDLRFDAIVSMGLALLWGGLSIVALTPQR
ncbi:hypothetical protein Sp245p_00685 [Azospirillum baldaniorum]|uniref:Uncharacterized protein n=2 Tax=Azospirillum TaxID=191 RepID=A0A560C5G2_9PROT|nr:MULTISPECIES: hypothetical protein [Azospirillum]TWA80092.1 hypothetical protein FBZ85_104433 [Azospirillum brasilense]AWJ88394.1 hypothetical protein Sp245p_00685 [Azospirillum baldaniorum]KAA1055476.1 hypothetical protein FH063_005247 [Azospirillum argentinense]MBK3799547.1 hypothetical protein [Azospirillum argentinense]NUB07211.1 hypothetical protein [Azospirillum baldaniorum]